MKPQRLLLACFLLLSASGFAQIGNTVMQQYPGAASGACPNANTVAINNSNGGFYTCPSSTGTWNAVSGGGGGGVSGSGTVGTLPIWVTNTTTLGNSNESESAGIFNVNTANGLALTGNSGNAGVLGMACGTQPGNGSNINWVAPLTCVPYNMVLPGAASSGYFQAQNVANVVTWNFEPAIQLNTSDVTGSLGVPNGGTGATTGSGALNNLFPTPIRNGDIIYWNGTAWNNFTGCATSFCLLSENAAGNPAWIQTPIGVVDGGYGLTTQSSGAVYKGNGTGAPQISAISDNGTNVTITTEPLILSSLSAGTSPICPNGTGGALTTSGCSGGGGSGISGQTTGYVPLAGSPITLTSASHIDDGVTTASVLTAHENFVAPAIIAGTALASVGSATGIAAAAEGSTAGTPTSGQDYVRADSTLHGYKVSVNGGAEFTSAMNLIQPATATIASGFASAPAGSKCLQSSGTSGLVVESSSACGSGGSASPGSYVTAGYAGGTVNAVANELVVAGIVIPVTFTSGHINLDVSTADGTRNSDFGVYTGTAGGTCTLLADVGAGTYASTGSTTKAWTQGTVTVPATTGTERVYFAMTSATSTTLVVTGSTNFFSYATSTAGFGTTTGGALPSTMTCPADSWVPGSSPTVAIN